MAATIGASLSGATFPDRHAGLGPFISSGGNVYFFGRDSTNVGHIEPHKASNPMSSFTAQTTKLMSSAAATSIQAAAAYQVSDVIHIVAQISTGAVYYNSYNMSTDAWTLTTSETAVAAASFAPTSGSTMCSLAVRSNGNVVIVYNAGQTAMSSTFNMVRYRERTDTNTYGTATQVDNGGSVSWVQPHAVLGASDRVHIFFAASTGSSYQRTLSSANALETFPASYATLANSARQAGTSYVDGGTTKVIQPLRNNSSPFAGRMATLDSADAPTVSVETTSTNGVLADVTNSQLIQAAVVDGTTRHFVFSDATASDLYRTENSGSGWGADGLEHTGTVNEITANVYTRSGTKYLAMVVDDGGTLKYAEITLAAATPTSFVWPTETPYRILARR